jgi:hypothetical protein
MPDFSIMLIWVLIVPILPAFLFQTLLPSQVEISGPLKGLLQGLNLKVVGGIAGYCVLVGLAWFVATDYLERRWEREQIAEGPKYEEWSVKGEVTIDGPLGDAAFPIIAFVPSFNWTPADEKNTFQFFGSLPIKRDVNAPQIGHFQAISISYANYRPTTVVLKDIKLTKEKPEVRLPPVLLTQWKGGKEEEHILKKRE